MSAARLEGLDRPWWWQPNRAALLRMLRSAGWEVVSATQVFTVPTGPGHPRPPADLRMARANGARQHVRHLVRLGRREDRALTVLD